MPPCFTRRLPSALEGNQLYQVKQVDNIAVFPEFHCRQRCSGHLGIRSALSKQCFRCSLGFSASALPCTILVTSCQHFLGFVNFSFFKLPSLSTSSIGRKVKSARHLHRHRQYFASIDKIHRGCLFGSSHRAPASVLPIFFPSPVVSRLKVIPWQKFLYPAD